MDFDKARVILEFGPGGGVFTRHLLKQMHPDAKLIAIENNDDLLEKIKKKEAAQLSNLLDKIR